MHLGSDDDSISAPLAPQGSTGGGLQLGFDVQGSCVACHCRALSPIILRCTCSNTFVFCANHFNHFAQAFPSGIKHAREESEGDPQDRSMKKGRCDLALGKTLPFGAGIRLMYYPWIASAANTKRQVTSDAAQQPPVSQVDGTQMPSNLSVSTAPQPARQRVRSLSSISYSNGSPDQARDVSVLELDASHRSIGVQVDADKAEREGKPLYRASISIIDHF